MLRSSAWEGRRGTDHMKRIAASEINELSSTHRHLVTIVLYSEFSKEKQRKSYLQIKVYWSHDHNKSDQIRNGSTECDLKTENLSRPTTISRLVISLHRMRERDRGRDGERARGREGGREIERGREVGREREREEGREGDTERERARGREGGSERKGGRESEREGDRARGREGGRQRERGREGGRETEREGGRETEREGGRETEREGER